MNFEQIKSFLSVARTGNFSVSAKERFISQPAISNQLKALEEELDTQLFLRNAKKITLTEKGEIFYKYASRLLSVEKDIVWSIKEKQENAYGIIDIAAPHLQTDGQLCNFFNRIIKEKKEEVICRIVQRDDEKIPQMVLDGEIEFGISNTVINNKNLVFEKAFVEEIVLVTPNQEKYRNLKPEELRELLIDEGHIRFDFGEGSDFLWNDFFGKIIGLNLHDIRTVARCSNYNLLLSAVERGAGIGFISNTVMQKEWKSGKILAYRCRELLEKPFYVVYNRERVEASDILRGVKDMLVKELEESIENPDESF